MQASRLAVRQEHEDTPTSKHVDIVERRLNDVLTQIYNRIKTDVSISSGVGVSFSTVRQVNEPQVRDVIRAAVTEIYIEAAKYVTAKASKLSFFMTETDLLLIKSLAVEFEGYFWTGLENEFIKKLARAFDPRTLLTMKNVQLKDTFVGRLSESLSHRVMAESTLSKTEQIADRARQAPAYRFAQTEEEEEVLDTFIFVGEAAFFALTAKPQRVVFVTARDEKVCPICAPLHGKVYDYDDPALPKPVLNTHLRCRCRIMLVSDSGKVVMK